MPSSETNIVIESTIVQKKILLGYQKEGGWWDKFGDWD